MIICADPDRETRAETVEALETAARARELSATRGDVDALVTEYDLPDGTGLELAGDVRGDHPDAFCLLFTDTPFADVDTAGSETVADYLATDDPEAHTELVSRLEDALALRYQTAYPLPDDEDARLAALDAYAADPDALGESFDRLTELATALFDVDAAAIGLVDRHEQRFLSCHGLAFDPIDREDTVCTYAVLDDAVTVVEDAAEDPRFRDNAALDDAGIRFYASAPLLAETGEAIGTFCVYHSTPRTLSERDRELLELLAEDAVDRLAGHRRLREATGGESRE